MGCTQNYGSCHHMNGHLIIPLIFLSVISLLTNAGFMAECRAISNLVDSASRIDYAPIFSNLDGSEDKVMRMGVKRRALIGSRPPRCESRCSSCGHCEAIQVPIVPFLKPHNTIPIRSTHFRFSATPTVASSRGDYLSNYKPICWKCKCGDFIFNP